MNTIEYDYFNLGNPSVKGLILSLQKIVDDNPDIDFRKVGVILSPENHHFHNTVLSKWYYNDKQRCIVTIY